MNEKNLIIFRALGNFENDQLKILMKDTNYQIITYPILKVINIYSKPIDIENAQAVLVTSSNGIYNLANLSNNRSVKIFTIGSSTKNLSEKLGYKNVIDCDGDSVKMYEVVIKNTKIADGSLIYVGADNISVDLPNMFKKAGYRVRRYIVYKTEELKVIDKNFIAMIKDRKVSWVVLLSRKGAANFYNLVKKYIKLNYFSDVKFACLSKKIADELPNSIAYKYVPNKPSLDNLKNMIIMNK